MVLPQEHSLGTKDAQYILVGAEHDEESHSLSGNRCGLPESWEVRDKND